MSHFIFGRNVVRGKRLLSLSKKDMSDVCAILRGGQKSNFHLKLWGKTRNINRGNHRESLKPLSDLIHVIFCF